MTKGTQTDMYTFFLSFFFDLMGLNWYVHNHFFLFFLVADKTVTPLVIHTFVISPDEIDKGKPVSLTGTATLSKQDLEWTSRANRM